MLVRGGLGAIRSAADRLALGSAQKYGIEADDLEVVQARMRERASSAEMSKPVAVQSDPPSTMRMLREMSVHTP